jgi:SAM-dependent methyltransferase
MSVSTLDFVCNACGASNSGPRDFGREAESCARCRSSVRIRSLLYAMSMEICGAPLALPDLPALKSLRGAGMSDSECYAPQLAEKFDYANTYYDREPRLDITAVPASMEGSLDFLVSSEVIEHVRPPLETAHANAYRLLRPEGLLFLTVPYLPQGPGVEHFPELHDYALAPLAEGVALVNRTRDGRLQVFDGLVFHGGAGATMEMRVLSEADIRRMLLAAGFSQVRIYAEDYEPFGVRNTESWSLPIVARKAGFRWDAAARAAAMGRYAETAAAVRRLTAETDARLEWARRLEGEFEAARERIRLVQTCAEERTRWARVVDSDLERARARIAELEAGVAERTDWSRSLEARLENAARQAEEMEKELQSRTEWARDLERQLSESRAAAGDLDRQFAERTEWAQRLDAEAAALRQEVHRVSSAPWSRLGRALRLAP